MKRGGHAIAITGCGVLTPLGDNARALMRGAARRALRRSSPRASCASVGESRLRDFDADALRQRARHARVQPHHAARHLRGQARARPTPGSKAATLDARAARHRDGVDVRAPRHAARVRPQPDHASASQRTNPALMPLGICRARPARRSRSRSAPRRSRSRSATAARPASTRSASARACSRAGARACCVVVSAFSLLPGAAWSRPQRAGHAGAGGSVPRVRSRARAAPRSARPRPRSCSSAPRCTRARAAPHQGLSCAATPRPSRQHAAQRRRRARARVQRTRCACRACEPAQVALVEHGRQRHARTSIAPKARALRRALGDSRHAPAGDRDQGATSATSLDASGLLQAVLGAARAARAASRRRSRASNSRPCPGLRYPHASTSVEPGARAGHRRPRTRARARRSCSRPP